MYMCINTFSKSQNSSIWWLPTCSVKNSQKSNMHAFMYIYVYTKFSTFTYMCTYISSKNGYSHATYLKISENFSKVKYAYIYVYVYKILKSYMCICIYTSSKSQQSAIRMPRTSQVQISQKSSMYIYMYMYTCTKFSKDTHVYMYIHVLRLSQKIHFGWNLLVSWIFFQ